MSDLGYLIFMAIMVVVFVVAFAVMGAKNKKYLNAQRENNTEKRAMLDLMSRVMEEQYANYTYVVGYYTQTTQKLNTTTYYYFPYILAFTVEELIVFPFIKKEGQLYVRNRLNVDWNMTDFQYKLRKNGVTITLKIMGEKMPINIDPVIKGNGIEKSDRPLCVFQEQEYEKLKMLLPEYASKAKKA
ncbi:MAG: hypothetical protein IJU80_11375 [Lachnospiraceae bacterium]|nr:hypothetical protein [Lachnospiraceae bacterium]